MFDNLGEQRSIFDSVGCHKGVSVKIKGRLKTELKTGSVRLERTTDGTSFCPGTRSRFSSGPTERSFREKREGPCVTIFLKTDTGPLSIRSFSGEEGRSFCHNAPKDVYWSSQYMKLKIL